MNTPDNNKILITGANGNLGKKLLLRLGDFSVRALVRSSSAKQKLEDFILENNLTSIEVMQSDYTNAVDMEKAVNNCTYVIHLVGIIKESRSNSFYNAHEASINMLCQVLADSQVKRVFYLSLLGSNPESTNACLCSRGKAEQILLAASTDSVIVRVPMVIGEGDYASHALRKQAFSKVGFSFRASSLEQPIYASDVLQAIVKDIERSQNGEQMPSGMLELAGPESLTRAALRLRANAILGQNNTTISLPLVLGELLAAAFQNLMANPPITQAMLGVLDHDDRIDTAPACSALGIELTGLDEMLAKTLHA